jgi:hypothetical protein
MDPAASLGVEVRPDEKDEDEGEGEVGLDGHHDVNVN